MLNASADAAADEAGEAFVRSWRRRLPDWWLMYSREKRRLMAFYQGYCPSGLWVEAEQPEELLEAMAREAQALWRSPATLASWSTALRSSSSPRQ